MRTVTSLRFDAGSVSLNLVATVGRRSGDPVERLTSTERLRDWLEGVGLPPPEHLTEDDLARARALRESLHQLFHDTLARRPPDVAALRAVNAAVSACPPGLAAGEDGVTLSTRSSEAVLAVVAADAIRILAGTERLDVRICEADDCRMLFLGHGQRARRWCSSERCGNRARVSAHRARAARETQHR